MAEQREAWFVKTKSVPVPQADRHRLKLKNGRSEGVNKEIQQIRELYYEKNNEYGYYIWN